MPYRKRYGKGKRWARTRAAFARRRKGGRYKKRGGRALSIIRGPTFMPDTIMNKHVFSQLFSVTGAGATAESQFSINNIFNVLVGGSAVQPMGFDQMTPMYERWQVFASKIDLTIINAETDGLHVLVFPFADTSAGFSSEQANSMQRARQVVLSGALGGTNVKTIRHFVKMKDIVGRQVFDINYTGSDVAAPSKVSLWTLYFETMTGVGITAQIRIKITYYVKWFERKNTTSS